MGTVVVYQERIEEYLSQIKSFTNEMKDRGIVPSTSYAHMELAEEDEKLAGLFGAVTYSAGVMGRELVRSQGHIHKVSPSCRCSTPKVYEIWEGTAIIYMQQRREDDPAPLRTWG